MGEPCKHLTQSPEAYQGSCEADLIPSRVLLCGWVTEATVAALPRWLQARAWSGGPISADLRECKDCPLYAERTADDE